MGYGLPASDVTSHYADLLSDMDSGVSEAFHPTIFYIPWLRYLPRWLPGGTWKSGVQKWRLQADSIREAPFMAAIKLMASVVCRRPFPNATDADSTEQRESRTVRPDRVVRQVTVRRNVWLGPGIHQSHTWSHIHSWC